MPTEPHVLAAMDLVLSRSPLGRDLAVSRLSAFALEPVEPDVHRGSIWAAADPKPTLHEGASSGGAR